MEGPEIKKMATSTSMTPARVLAVPSGTFDSAELNIRGRPGSGAFSL